MRRVLHSGIFSCTQSGQVKNTPWGSSYRAAPEILHGGCLGDEGPWWVLWEWSLQGMIDPTGGPGMCLNN